jgi:hypothetical protein
MPPTTTLMSKELWPPISTAWSSIRRKAHSRRIPALILARPFPNSTRIPFLKNLLCKLDIMLSLGAVFFLQKGSPPSSPAVRQSRPTLLPLGPRKAGLEWPPLGRRRKSAAAKGGSRSFHARAMRSPSKMEIAISRAGLSNAREPRGGSHRAYRRFLLWRRRGKVPNGSAQRRSSWGLPEFLWQWRVAPTHPQRTHRPKTPDREFFSPRRKYLTSAWRPFTCSTRKEIPARPMA